MKKILTLILALALVAPVAVAKGNNREKELRKECKAKTKELKKQGWQIFGSTRTLEGAIANHFEQLIELGDDVMEMYGVATNVKSKNAGLQMANNSACINYANQQGTDLKGRMMSENMVDADNPDAEFDKFYSAYERSVEKEIKGEMRPSYQLIRTNANGTYEIEVYYLVSESAASRARVRALENAMAESEAAHKYADKVSQFVREGFKN